MPTFLLATLLSLTFFAEVQMAKAQFVEREPGLEYSEFRISKGLLSSELVVLRIDPKKFDVKAVKLSSPSTAKAVVTESDSIAAINANFFGTDLQALGLIISNSKQLHGIQSGGRTLTGIFYIESGIPKIVHRESFKSTSEVSQAIQAGPRLISDRKSVFIPEDHSTRRSAVGIDGKGNVLLVTSKDRFPGLMLKELQQFLMGKELDLVDAVNLDGGGSSQLFIAGTKNSEEVFVSGGDNVPVFLVVEKKR
jgi:uncharacterized protein YigE (DUF2233 family)